MIKSRNKNARNQLIVKSVISLFKLELFQIKWRFRFEFHKVCNHYRSKELFKSSKFLNVSDKAPNMNLKLV